MIVILNNRRIISRLLSSYALLNNAADDQLTEYELSDSGIHWPALDADLSRRGLLMEEIKSNFQSLSFPKSAA
ncbi:DUF2442 domain-containing protein [Larkinella soli]|uniref:DUF2442 domain-containing protein n=1 Tax=Larkinella soli TaxID=1770527 RepID=UPI000FFB6DFB|nr:DUF2442 domain-containing protein [Larkinella soli]